jgi:pimeloyl-ACP methyl ester carboxylesterase
MLTCAAGYDHVRWEQSQPGGPIDISVNELNQVVKATKSAYGVDKVVLVGHSRGGLISRKYVLDKWRDRWNDGGGIDVAKVITFGTPHLGAELATLGEEVLTSALFGVLLDLIDPIAGAFDLAATLELIGNLFGQQVKETVEHDILGLLSPIVDRYWTNFTEFAASGEELRPDSAFIEDLNAGYADAQVEVKGQTLSLWEAIPHVLIAGTSPDFITLWLGSWLENFTVLGWLEALEPHIGWTTVNVFGATIRIPWTYYPWEWHWRPLVRIMGDVAALNPTLAPLDTFKEGRGDSIVARSSALAEGMVGPSRAEFALDHFNIYTNSEQTTGYQTPGGSETVNSWQLLFLELGVTDIISVSSACSGVQGCEDFDISDALP